MKFTIVKDPIPFLIIDEIYSPLEQLNIFKEIEFLQGKLLSPEYTGSGTLIDGSYTKKNRGIFIDEFYSNREFSNILGVNRKVFSQEIKNKLISTHYAYKLIDNTNQDTTLLSYYDDGDMFHPHNDRSVLTIITWFYKEPKNFTGGDLIFSDYNVNVELKHNRCVIFFSSYVHEITNVNINDRSIPFSGRFSLSQFCFVNLS